MRSADSTALSYSVLVLNRNYMAVHIASAKRAFGLLYRDLAEVIDLDDGHYANYNFDSWQEISEIRSDGERGPHEDWVRAVRFEIQVPRVIRLFRYDRLPRRTLRFNRRNLFARDGHCCQYCRRNLPTSQLSIDHVVPRSKGGGTNWENVVCCCKDCNTKKGGRTPHEAHMNLWKKPAKPRHSPLLAYKLNNPKYECWRLFLGGTSWAIDVA